MGYVIPLLLGLSLLFSAGCRRPAAGGSEPDPGRFGDPAKADVADADVVIEFSSWQYSCITRPPVAEGVFAHFMARPELERVLARLAARRNLAVVVCMFDYGPGEEARQQADWSSILSRSGFRRVLFVRQAYEQPLEDAEILRDQRLD